MNKCRFELTDKKGVVSCGAAVCYSDQKCNARDKDGNPLYDEEE